MLPTQPSLCCRYRCITLNLMAQERDQRRGDFSLSCIFLGGQGDPQWTCFVLLIECGLNSLMFCFCFALFFNLIDHILYCLLLLPAVFLQMTLLYICKGVWEMILQKDTRLRSFSHPTKKKCKHAIKLAILIFSVFPNILISDCKPCCLL